MMEQEVVSTKKTMGDRIIQLLFCLYFILKPFYFWGSGLPQISDCILILLTVFYILRRKLLIYFFSKSKGFIYFSLAFILYAAVVNGIWSLILGIDFEFFTTSAFYVFNFIASLLMVLLYYEYRQQLYKYIFVSVSASIFLQMVMYFVSGGFKGERSTSFFNNPNQLGYYSLLILGFLLVVSEKRKIRRSYFIISIGASLILCFSSLSKAAIITYSGMLLYFLMSKLIRKKINVKRVAAYFLVLLVLLAVGYASWERIASNELYAAVQERISSIGADTDDNLSARGYDRLTKYPHYLIFGAGEGQYLRFGYTVEFHSTLGNILVSYGIVGLLLYLASIILAIKNNGFREGYIIFFIFLYGLTHNGIRNTLLWMLVALISV